VSRPLRITELVEDRVIESDWGRTQRPFNVFSPSMTGYCRRQMYNRRFDLTKMERYIQGILHAGTVNHFWLEHHVPELVEDRGVRTEVRVKERFPVEEKDFDVFVSGYADVVDSEGFVYDYKFTGDTSYVEDSPKDKDKRQVMVYLAALGDVHTGRLEYVTRDGTFHPDNAVYHGFEFDQEVFDGILGRMVDVAEKARLAELQGTEVLNPFDKCESDCYFCGNEVLKKSVVEEQERLRDG
jgi:hypothetical protein